MVSGQNSGRRVVITGVGVVSPIGIGVDAFWESLAAGRSGVSRIDRLSYSALPNNVGAEIKEFTEENVKKEYLKNQRKSIKVMCREIQLGVASASFACEHAGLDSDQIDHARLGVEFGANQMQSPPEVLKDACFACSDNAERQFGFEKWGTTGLGSMEPLWLLKFLPNMPACHIGIAADARGPNNSLTLSDASGNVVLGEAYRIIVRGSADIMIAGSTGTRIEAIKCLHAALQDELASSIADPAAWSRPFDANRTGQVVGEGACSFILEEESHAQARRATILGTILGAGSSCVQERGGKPNYTLALANSMSAALHDARLAPSDVGHINAHGLSGRRMDADEAAAIHAVFGNAAETIPVTALKSYLGNSGAGSGMLEMAGSLLGLRHGVVPPTLNYENPDPACRLHVVHSHPMTMPNKIFVNTNVTTAGQASSVIVCGA